MTERLQEEEEEGAKAQDIYRESILVTLVLSHFSGKKFARFVCRESHWEQQLLLLHDCYGSPCFYFVQSITLQLNFADVSEVKIKWTVVKCPERLVKMVNKSSLFSWWGELFLGEVFSFQCSSVQFSHSVVSNSLRPYELQQARPPCPSPTPRVHSNPCPLSQWCHPTISSPVVPFSSCLQFSFTECLFLSFFVCLFVSLCDLNFFK